MLRPDLTSAHDQAWNRLGRAGTWLTAEERLEIVRQAREAFTCELCKRRKAALSPYAVKEEHAASAPLGAVEVDAVHRIATDAGRLTQAWFQRLALAPERYVELLTTTAHTVALDTFHRATGLELRALPPNQGGAPSRAYPEGKLNSETAWVPMQDLPGEYNVLRAISLVPDELRAVREVTRAEYVPTERVADLAFDPRRRISRAQMEHIAGRTSVRNGCFY